ncbi:MAG: hypothetical protein R2706_11475 [Acidimicrobiales bacterium]
MGQPHRTRTGRTLVRIIDGEQTPGATIMITMTAEEGSPSEPARIIECDPPNRFVIETWNAGEPWRLCVDLAELDGVTTMTFTQVLTGDLDAADIGPGWEFYADRHHAASTATTCPTGKPTATKNSSAPTAPTLTATRHLVRGRL